MLIKLKGITLRINFKNTRKTYLRYCKTKGVKKLKRIKKKIKKRATAIYYTNNSNVKVRGI